MKKKRLFMNLKKKLAVFMSLSSLLNTSTIKGANDINYDHRSENFDYEEEDDDDDECGFEYEKKAEAKKV